MTNLPKIFSIFTITTLTLISLTACQTTSSPSVKPTASVMIGAHGH